MRRAQSCAAAQLASASVPNVRAAAAAAIAAAAAALCCVQKYTPAAGSRAIRTKQQHNIFSHLSLSLFLFISSSFTKSTMESESIVNYLESSTGKPWPLKTLKTLKTKPIQSSPNHNEETSVTTHIIDSLYPEWDEFYLLVCDICGIIIRPQALEKHLKRRHKISVQNNNNNNNSTNNNSCATESRNKNDNNVINKNNNTIATTDTSQDCPTTKRQKLETSNGYCYDLTLYGLEPLSPPSTATTPPQLSTLPPRYRKWRKTFFVLRDAFF